MRPTTITGLARLGSTISEELYLLVAQSNSNSISILDLRMASNHSGQVSFQQAHVANVHQPETRQEGIVAMSQQKHHLTVTYMDHISVFKETTLDSGEILRKNIGADFNTRAIFVEDKVAYSQEDKFIIDETIFGGIFGQDNSYGHLGAVNDLIYDSGQIISGSDDASVLIWDLY
jgi:hypothetical protein